MKDNYDLNPYREFTPVNPNKGISITNNTPDTIQFNRLPSSFDSVNFEIRSFHIFAPQTVKATLMGTLEPGDTIHLTFHKDKDLV